MDVKIINKGNEKSKNIEIRELGKELYLKEKTTKQEFDYEESRHQIWQNVDAMQKNNDITSSRPLTK